MTLRIFCHVIETSVFVFQAKRVNEKKRRRWFEEALKEGDRRANEALPQVTLSTLEASAHALAMLDTE